MSRVRAYVVESRANSECGSARFSDLYFDDWSTDGFPNEAVYLHVAGFDNTRHRVRCKRGKAVALAYRYGKLYWIVEGR